MCGIYGKVTFENTLDVSSSICALRELQHRGPDGFGWATGNYQDNTLSTCYNSVNAPTPEADVNYFIGHQRLSIIDLSETALQPMVSSDKDYVISFNGEIYNHVELKEELLEKGHKFHTDHSDTEVLLYSFVEWQEKCLDKLRGMYAFAVYNKKAKTIFIARDRIGQKPLYYYFSQDKFIFASELTSIVKYEKEKFSVDETSLFNYLKYGYVPCPGSIFNEVKKLPPACYGWVDLGSRRIEIKEYWDIDLAKEKRCSKGESIEAVDRAINESVRGRLRADVPIGAFISGGIDSTLIVKKMTGMMEEKLDVYGADFPEGEFSEKPYMVLASEKYQANLHVTMIDERYFANFKDLISIFDEPFDGGSAIALNELFSVIKNNKKVIVTGDGGDEIFAGYRRYWKLLWKVKILRVIEKTGIAKRFLKFLFGHFLTIIKQKTSNVIDERFLVDSTLHSLGSSLTSLMINEVDPPVFYESFFRGKERYGVKSIQYLDMKGILQGRMMYKLDRMSMHFSIEARSPFLDHKVVELAFSIPSRHMIGMLTYKKILKAMLSKDFDNSFIERTKRGFGSPVERWLRTVETSEMFPLLQDENSQIFRCLDFEKTQKKYPQIKDGYDGRDRRELWRLVVLALYLENYKAYISDT